MAKVQISENDLKQMVYKSIVKVLNENNFKTPSHRRRAAINIAGRKRGKTPEEIRQDILDAEAKSAAIRDINKERSIRSMSNHERRFNNSINNDTFDTDFTELDYYDPYYDDFTKNNKEMEGLNPLIWQGSNDYQD